MESIRSVPDLVTKEEACELLGGIDPSTLYRGVKQRRFPSPIKLGPGIARWSRAEIASCIANAAAARGGKAA